MIDPQLEARLAELKKDYSAKTREYARYKPLVEAFGAVVDANINGVELPLVPLTNTDVRTVIDEMAGYIAEEENNSLHNEWIVAARKKARMSYDDVASLFCGFALGEFGPMDIVYEKELSDRLIEVFPDFVSYSGESSEEESDPEEQVDLALKKELSPDKEYGPSDFVAFVEELSRIMSEDMRLQRHKYFCDMHNSRRGQS